jgi:hypothetical protein
MENDMETGKEVIAWKVVFEDGSVEYHPAESISGEPTFGRWITPMVAGGETIDIAPENDEATVSARAAS